MRKIATPTAFPTQKLKTTTTMKPITSSYHGYLDFVFLLFIISLLSLHSASVLSQAETPITPGSPSATSNSPSISQPLTILHLGDSHTAGFYGKRLHQLLSSQGNTVTTYGCVGADAQDYALSAACNPRLGSIKIDSSGQITELNRIDTFDKIITAVEPEVIIITLGTNFIIPQNVLAQKENIIPLISTNKKCYWIGAPHTKVNPTVNEINAEEINQELKTLLLSYDCIFIDPIESQMTNPDTLSNDGIHYTRSGGEKWAESVYAQIVSPLNLPLVSPPSLSPLNEPEEFNSGDAVSEILPPIEGSPNYVLPTSTNQALRQFDDAWLRFASLIHPSLSNKVYVPNTGFVSYSQAYPAAAFSSAAISYSGSSAKGQITSQQSAIARAISSRIGIDPKLGIAILKYESSGNPNAISSTGCSGLMQICMGSAPSNIILNQCKQYRSQGPQPCSNGQPDDRFDQEKNIQAGLTILKQKLDFIQTRNICASGPDEIRCAIASYNAGQNVIAAAAAQAKITYPMQSPTQPTWTQIYAQITPKLLREAGYTGPYWTENNLYIKIQNLGSYVNAVYNDYNRQ